MLLHPDSCSSFIEDALNISSPLPQTPAIENFTIQSYVKAYVEKFVGGYTVVSNPTIICLINLTFEQVFVCWGYYNIPLFIFIFLSWTQFNLIRNAIPTAR